MAIREIVKAPAEVLKKRCEPVTAFTPELQDFIGDLIETMIANRGAGLAAPQVGMPVQVAVYRLCRENKEDDVIKTLINPYYIAGNKRFGSVEGCLSIPDQLFRVCRSETVRVCGMDENGHSINFHATGFEAIVIQHEIDHLHGVLISDLDMDIKVVKE